MTASEFDSLLDQPIQEFCLWLFQPVLQQKIGAVDAAKTLGQYGSAVDIARIKAEQEKERQINDMTARAAGLWQ